MPTLDELQRQTEELERRAEELGDFVRETEDSLPRAGDGITIPQRPVPVVVRRHSSPLPWLLAIGAVLIVASTMRR